MSKLSLVKDEPENVDEKVNDFMSDYEDAAIISDEKDNEEPENDEPENNSSGSQQKESSQLNDPAISGLAMLSIIDMVLPSLVVFAYKKVTKKNVKIPQTKLQLTKKQLKTLEPWADKVAEQMDFGEANPVVMLIVSMGSMYYLNLMNVLHDFETS